MLWFVGLGLWDERSVTVRGRDAIKAADVVVTERYTSRLAGTTIENLEAYHDTEIEVLDRSGIEVDPDPVLSRAGDTDVAFLIGGDPMISTTHVDLRLRAVERGIDTRVIHGPSAGSAAAGLTGLQNYRFGKATTIPFPGTFGEDGVPQSVVDTIEDNSNRGLHTLAFLDLDEARDRALSGSVAAEMLGKHLGDRLGVVVARAGSEDPLVTAAPLNRLAEGDFGGPLHLLVVPGDLHAMEAEALVTFADAPERILDGSGVTR